MKSAVVKPLADLARDHGKQFAAHGINTDVVRKIMQSVTSGIRYITQDTPQEEVSRQLNACVNLFTFADEGGVAVK
eukprot:4699303-Amphidinium_carterae.1